MSGHLPFLVDYAKTSRAKCKGCKSVIDKDNLRVAKVVRSPFHDGVMPAWYHQSCFFKKNLPTSVAEIENFDNIRWEDQQSLKSQIEPAEPPSTPSGPPSPRKRPHPAQPDFHVEYSRSNRAKCMGCDAPIAKGVIRFGKLDTESPEAVRYQGITHYYHLDCFIELRKALKYFCAPDATCGFEKLQLEDQKMLQKMLPAMDEPNGPSPPKKAKPVSLTAEEEQQLKEQNERLFKLREELQTVSKADRVQLLMFNDQHVPKGEAAMLDALSDQMAFGALRPCKKCSGSFEFCGAGYKCQGDLTEWTKCDELTQDPERTEFKVPNCLKDSAAFLKDYKSTVSGRILRVVTPSELKPVRRAEEPLPKVNRGPMPLRGLKFVIAGKSAKDKEKLRAEIMALGGAVGAEVHRYLAAVIADDKTLAKNPRVVKEAKYYGIQVVTEDFVEEAKDFEDTPVSLITKKNIAPWGDDPRSRIGNISQKSSSSKSISGGKVKLTVKGGGAVDPASGLVDVAHVYEENGERYSVVLVQSDIQAKKNSFYKLQVLKHDHMNQFHLFRSWGRIGSASGGKKVEQLPSQYSCLHEFRKLYAEKTGNLWVDRKSFVKKPGMMYPLDTEDDPEEEDEAQKLESEVPCNLQKPVQDLMKVIFDITMMKKVMKEYELDTEKMPLGKLSKKQLQKAYEVLKEVQVLLSKGQPARARLIDATNRFYTLVPHSFGDGEPVVLDSDELIKAKCEMLDSLIEMEIAYSLLNVKSDDTKNPIDMHYEQLNADIEVLDRDSEEFKVIEEYTRNTHAATHRQYELEIEDVFVVKRQGEDKRYKPFRKLHNRKLLWHGSRTTNFAGILSQGLRIAPPEAPVSGYMFGKGIYFADMVSKSANYCCTSSQSPTGLLLLCEVALGNMYERLHGHYIEKLPKGKHSTLGRGSTQPDPEKFYKTPDGVEVPYGPGVPANLPERSSLLYNEYIVYNAGQVNVKYLIRMNFKYKY